MSPARQETFDLTSRLPGREGWGSMSCFSGSRGAEKHTDASPSPLQMSFFDSTCHCGGGPDGSADLRHRPHQLVAQLIPACAGE